MKLNEVVQTNMGKSIEEEEEEEKAKSDVRMDVQGKFLFYFYFFTFVQKKKQKTFCRKSIKYSIPIPSFLFLRFSCNKTKKISVTYC